MSLIAQIGCNCSFRKTMGNNLGIQTPWTDLRNSVIVHTNEIQRFLITIFTSGLKDSLVPPQSEGLSRNGVQLGLVALSRRFASYDI